MGFLAFWGDRDAHPRIRRSAPAMLALAAGAIALSGCAGARTAGSTSSSTTHISGAALESSERAEVVASLGNEQQEQAKVRELLSKVEAKKREEEAEASAKKTEAAATARAKRREKEAEKAAKRKVAAAEAALKKREEEATQREAAAKAKAVAKPVTKQSKRRGTATSDAAPAQSIGAAPSVTVPSGSN